MTSIDSGRSTGASRPVVSAVSRWRTIPAAMVLAVTFWLGWVGSASAQINDSFTNRLSLSGLTNNFLTANLSATKEPGEPNHAGITGGKSLWWTWRAPVSGTAIIDTIGSSFDTVLGVYTGTTLTSLTPVASDDDNGGNGTSRVLFDAVGGTFYQVAVDGFGGASGGIALNIALVPPSPPQITSGPQGQTVTAGAQVQFSVVAGGSVPFTFQWRFNDVAVAGATNSSYTRNNVQTNDAGIYNVVVANIAGSATSTNAALVVLPGITFSTLAGLAGLAGTADGTGSAARFDQPNAVAVDATGNVFVADANNHIIRRIAPGGVVTTFAGLAGANGVADGTGSAARFRSPRGIAVDASGNVYVADTFNHTIRKITSAGGVTTLAGTGGLTGSADGTGAGARFDLPNGVAVDAAGNVFVTDSNNHLIRRITPGGVVTTFAGLGGSPGSADGTGAVARFFLPSGLAVETNGTLTVADYANHTIRRITAAGAVTTIAGTAGLSGSTDGAGTAARFANPSGVAVDALGSVFVADYNNSTLRRITPAGAVTTLAGLAGVNASADGTGSATRFFLPAGVALDADGNVIMADTRNHTIRRGVPDENRRPPLITFPPQSQAVLQGSNATFTVTVSGTSPLSYQWLFNGTNLPGATGSSLLITNVQPANAGFYRVFISNFVNTATSTNVALTVLFPSGHTFSTLAGLAGNTGTTDATGDAARFNNPTDVAVDSAGNVYVADRDNHLVRRIAPGGVVTTLAGSPGLTGSTDGTGAAARFNQPTGVAVDSAGNVLVADTSNHTIRRITPAGVVTTLAGLALSSGAADGSGGAARFFEPRGVSVDGAGNTFVADTANHTIRRVSSGGGVLTIAGLSGNPGNANGSGTVARFNSPYGIAATAGGTVFVVDDNHLVRMVTPSGLVSSLAGLSGASGGTDGTGTAARFNYPSGLAVDAAGTVFVGDTLNHMIRQVTPAGVVTTLGGVVGARGSADGREIVARFNYPWGMAVDSAGFLYVADSANHTVRRGAPGGGSTAPTITQQPQGVVTNLGATVQLSVVATGPGQLNFQWHRNGADLAGQTNTALLLSPVNRATSGTYDVLVSGPGGIQPSSNAVVRVLVPQRLLPPARLPGGAFRVTFGDDGGSAFTTNDLGLLEVYASTNVVLPLTNWVRLTNSLMITNGQVFLDDPAAASLNPRFYRVIER